MPLLAAVLGDPIDHSLSPILHGHWLRCHRIRGYYVPIRATKECFPATLESLQRMGFAGVNVTVPNKELALLHADHASDLAKRIGAANMLTFTDDGVHADNTDALGFTWNVTDQIPDWRPRRAVVLGAGGASRAILAALTERGVDEICLVNRNLARAETLAEEFGSVVRPYPWAERHKTLAGCDTLINATSLGMAGNPALDLSIDALPPDALVTDLVYTPLNTPLLAKARKRGNTAVDGLGMLLHQAVPAFEKWFGVKPTVDEKLRSIVLKKT